MAKKKKHKKRRVSGATYAAVGRPGKRRKGKKVGKHKKRRRMGSGADFLSSLKDYSLFLLGGGVAKVGADMLNPMMYGLTKGPLVPALVKAAAGSGVFYLGKKGAHPLLMGAGIGLGVSALEDGARLVQLPWLPIIPITVDAKGVYTYKSISGPAKDLFVVLPDHRQVSGPDEEMGEEMGEDAPVISAEEMGEEMGNDAPVISGETYSNVIGY